MGCAKTKELTEGNFQGGLIGSRCLGPHKRSCLEDDEEGKSPPFAEAVGLETVARGSYPKTIKGT